MELSIAVSSSLLGSLLSVLILHLLSVKQSDLGFPTAHSVHLGSLTAIVLLLDQLKHSLQSHLITLTSHPLLNLKRDMGRKFAHPRLKLISFDVVCLLIDQIRDQMQSAILVHS